MGLRWADRADPSWQHFKDHLSGPHRGAMCLDLGVWASVPLVRAPPHPLPNRHHHPAPLLPKLCLKCCCFLFRPVYCANKRRSPDPCTTCPVRSLFIVSASQRSFKATPGHRSSHHFDFARHLKQTDSFFFTKTCPSDFDF